MDKLISALQSRSDGYWELLATAVGREDALRRCLEGVSAKALDAGFAGPSVSPSIVQERVNALAGFDTRLLVDLSREWRAPENVSLDLMDEAADFWGAAWSAALRFLKKHGAPVPVASKAVPRVIRLEQEILWPPSPVEVRSLEDLMAFGVDGSRGYDDYRRLDASRLRIEGEVTEKDVVQLLGGSVRPSSSELERLRILIPRPHLVGGNARSWLRELLQSRWLALREPPPAAGGLLVLLNLVMALHSRSELGPEIEDHFIEVLRNGESPAVWAPFGYLLLRRGWHVA